MVTVNFQGGPGDEINIFTALRAWLSSHNAVVPQEEVFGTGESAQQVQNQDVEEMADSQEVATAAALTWLHIPFKTITVVAQTESLIQSVRTYSNTVQQGLLTGGIVQYTNYEQYLGGK